MIAPPVHTRWWRGSGRWSLNTLLRGFRAALWGEHHFRLPGTLALATGLKKKTFLQGLSNAIYGAARS
ncbi:MAG: hypothetical protein Q9P01_00240 [Anaerolineae bacterium]|nr:hypothetical protein [Anaerolineae bacterium]